MMGARWLLRVIAWDGLLPVVVWGAPWAAQWLAPGDRGLMEILGVMLPLGALFVRYFIGARQIAANRCKPTVRRLQILALCLGIFMLVLIDSMMILSLEMPPGALFATTTDLIVWGVLYAVYILTMLVAMYPGRDADINSSLKSRLVFHSRTCQLRCPTTGYLIVSVRSGQAGTSPRIQDEDGSMP